jgi:hypothetical protein
LSQGRFLVLLAFTLVFTSTQCVALCVQELCSYLGVPSTSGPADELPCHHHHDAPGKQGPAAPCHHQTVQAEVPQGVATQAEIATAAPMVAPIILPAEYSSLLASNAQPSDVWGPPGITALSSVVLRI